MTAVASTSARLEGAFVLAVAVITALIEGLAQFEHFRRILLFDRGQSAVPRLNQSLRHLHPLSLVDRTTAYEQQVAGLDERGRAVPQGLPFRVGAWRGLFDAGGRHIRADGVEDTRRRRI